MFVGRILLPLRFQYSKCCYSSSNQSKNDNGQSNNASKKTPNDKLEKVAKKEKNDDRMVFIKRDSTTNIESLEQKLRNRIGRFSQQSSFKYQNNFDKQSSPYTVHDAAVKLSRVIAKDKTEAKKITENLLSMRVNRQQQNDFKPFGKIDMELNSFKIDFKDLKDKESVTSCNATFDMIESHEFRSQTTMSPTNQFEEWIQWTRDGKLWQFPINNEQGMESEESIGFEEHVFIEWRCPELPETGPIAHFMELVSTGLSKNPFLTVEEKREHIHWLTTYLRDKVKIVEESINETKRLIEQEEKERQKVLQA